MDLNKSCLDSKCCCVFLIIFCCRSGTKGKCGEVDPVLTAGVSSCGFQSITTDPGQNSGKG